METECACCKIMCQYCNCRGEHQFIEGQHKEECPNLSLRCRNKCKVGSAVAREDMEAHRKGCPLAIVQCEYHNVGCEVRMTRKDLQRHRKEKMEDHLVMATHKLSRINDIHHELTGMQNELSITKTELAGAKVQLTTVLEQINNLTILVNSQLSPQTHSRGIRSIHLDAMVTMFKTGRQVCPVTIKFPGYKIINK